MLFTAYARLLNKCSNNNNKIYNECDDDKINCIKSSVNNNMMNVIAWCCYVHIQEFWEILKKWVNGVLVRDLFASTDYTIKCLKEMNRRRK